MFKFKNIAIAKRTRQRGFTLLEVLVATILLLTGIVAVAQLVPVAVTASNNSRRDSTASIVAQRQLSAFLEQPLTTLGPIPDAFGQGNNCALGDPTAPGVTVGSPVVVIGNRPTINFAAGAVANYSFTMAADPEDPYGARFDIRWAVITGGNGATASSRRFIIGARQINTRNYVLPLTLDAMVQR
jgi:prepilin-type N-terminal cleavage/methylation domain-containing protein